MRPLTSKAPAPVPVNWTEEPGKATPDPGRPAPGRTAGCCRPLDKPDRLKQNNINSISKYYR